ncbi:3-mercaptopyruvate sulfurtransferase [Pelistega indica]|uniref:3-mercaptopyruvate sulfurtransferase n=1 Tax=Pelistega indica TaxID=1414851 RepID=V8FZR2_9BURK|nr:MULTISPECIES: sulfurtransferase [Pelistega]ETD69183.1 3-mercaptopyruvate sulfurtransferase [Pelistega indica]
MTSVLISAEEILQKGLNAFRFIDARHDLVNHQLGTEQYIKAHIPTAIFLNHETDLCDVKTGKNGRHPLPKREDFANVLMAKGIHIDDDIVVYDADNMMFAAHVWWMLRWMGFANVWVLNGGFKAWQVVGGDVEEGIAPALPPVTWTLRESLVKTVSADEVLKNIQSQQFVLLDARAPERYRGEVEPMDPVAGHIPGAINHPFALNVEADGKMKSPQVLRDAFLPYTQKGLVINQCGSGVTACHNILAMEVAGLHDYALYPGSWSEWVADSTRPVATGE